MKKPCIAILCGLVLAGCTAHKEYDISYGVNPEMTLFEQELSFPVGSSGAIGLQYLLDEVQPTLVSLGLEQDILSQDEEGNIVVSQSGNLVEASPYRVLVEMEEAGLPNVWTVESDPASPVVSFLGSLFDIRILRQRFEFSANNPLNTSITLQATSTLTALDDSYETVHSEEVVLEESTVKRNRSLVLATFSVPDEFASCMLSAQVQSLEYRLPDNFRDRFDSYSSPFIVEFRHEASLAVGGGFMQRLSPEVNAGLNVARYRLRQMQLNVEVENTLPLAVVLDSAKVYKVETGDEEAGVDENVRITQGLRVEGGSLEQPSVSTLRLEVEALEGTLPDLSKFRLYLTLKGDEKLEDVLLNVRQGARITKASALIKGGITLFNDGGTDDE